jgi:parallel beta-helix repeat protein
MNQHPLVRKGIAGGIILLFIGTAILSSTGQMIDKRLMPISQGTILYVGGNGPGNYTKIQDAIENASTGDTVFVFPGTYYENLRVDVSIWLIGEEKNTTIIDGNRVGNVTVVSADTVVIGGFTLQHSGENHRIGYSDSAVCLLSNGNIITGNIIKDNPRNGISSRTTMNNTIAHNVIANNTYDGIELFDSSKNRIENNTFDSDGGIYIDNGSENSISDNVFTNCLIASIMFESCSNNRIIHNTITKNTVSLPSNIGYYSIFLSTSNGTLISENTFVNTIDNSHNIMMTDCFNNTIVRNNFFNVRRYVYFAESSQNVWDGNYWGRARFFPKIILGQKGLYDRVPTALNFDWHPAREPYDIPTI